MSLEHGRYHEDTVEETLNAMIADAVEYWGDLNDTERATIKKFYRPIAERLVDVQADIGLILDSSQIDHASGTALDLLCALIGIRRQPSSPASGTVEFRRSTEADRDYTISSGTTVQTDSNNPVRFETTESVILEQGTVKQTVEVEAVDPGPDGNVGPNAIEVMPDPPTGVEEVANPEKTIGGSDEETDDELRQRAKNELGAGSRASAPALVNSVSRLDDVTSVSIFVNDSSDDNTVDGGLPDHSFELVINGGLNDEIADAILETKAAGDNAYAGVNGTAASGIAELPNGQEMEIEFSRPDEVKIYVDVEVEVTDLDAINEDDVTDSIVTYIGGLLSSGNEVDGLGVGEDVIHGEIEYAIRENESVYDVPSLLIDTSDPPEQTTNLSIADSSVATADGTDTSITVTLTEVDP